MRPSVIHDEKVYKQVIKDLAAGVSQRAIAQSLGVDESAISRWKRGKQFRKDLALAEIAISREPIDKLRNSNPLAWLERRFRSDWCPPKHEVEANVNIQYSGWDDKDSDTSA